ncbi:MAG: chromosome partitioning protein ParB [Sphingomonadales bacterium]|nr:MAG: chromosome partitioning protein ParB [Sphingomonadales bacterium]
MKLQFIALSKLSVSKANMRHARKAPDISDILPTVRQRGVIVPLLVRPKPCPGLVEARAPADGPGAFEVVAGARRLHAALTVAAERRAAGEEGEAFDPDPMPCAILDEGDDAMAIEASLIENVARRDPDEVTQWETFTRLVREGRSLAQIAETFGMPDLAVRRVLALGNLLPRIRDLYRREEIDRATVRHLTLASKARQREWLALIDDPETRAPTGQGLKSWLLGGQSIPARHALFDTEGMALVADLFGEDAYFAEADDFWAKQDEAIEARRAAYLEAGWREVVVVPRGEWFHAWQYEKTPKRKGGRVYIDVQQSGEVTFHEGYVTNREARAKATTSNAGDESAGSDAKPARAEITANLGTYVDLHRHAATRAALICHPGIALRLMVAHAVVGSPLWAVRPEPQATRDEGVSLSLAESKAEAEFDLARLKVLRLLGLSEDEPRVTGGNGDTHGLVGLFLRLVGLGDEDVMAVLAVVMGETLHAGSAAVDAVAAQIGIDMARYWQADEALFALIRDREVLVAMLGEVAGARTAEANAKEKGKTLKTILRAHLDGADGREKVEGWVPRWLAFPPSAYTARGGVGSVAACERAAAAARASVAQALAREAEESGAGEPGEVAVSVVDMASPAAGSPGTARAGTTSKAGSSDGPASDTAAPTKDIDQQQGLAA